MEKKAEEKAQELKTNEIMIGGQVYEMFPLKGKTGRKQAKKLMTLVGDAVHLLTKDTNLDVIFSGENVSLNALTDISVKASRYWVQHGDAAESLFPILLPQGAVNYLETEATTGECIKTFLLGLLPYHLGATFGLEGVSEALKKLTTTATAEETAEVP